MYLRFVLGQAYLPGRQRAGILRITGAPRRFRLPRRRRDASQRLYDWLNRSLPVPPEEVFSGGRGLCWLKADAASSIRRLRAIADLYQAEGIRVWEIYSRHPGLITYEDRHQVVAVPFSSLGVLPTR